MTVYLDNAATTPIMQPVLEAMLPYLTTQYGNPSTLYNFGREARKAVEKARQQIAKAINAEPNQIYFTSGATESNNWVCSNFDYVFCSPYEHHSILNIPNIKIAFDTHSEQEFIEWFKQKINYKLEHYNLFKNNPRTQKLYLNKVLVSHMAVNNEIGTIYDIKNMAKICHENHVLFHTDATQSFGHIPIDVKDLDVDFLSLSAHKFHGAKGVGILYIKEPDKFKPFIYGGGQEQHRRAGTENVASIVSMGKACELYNYSPDRDKRCKEIQNKFYQAFAQMKDVHFNTDINNSISTTLNVAFKGVESESLMLLLDMEGICVSAGSACNSGSLEPSHVLKAIGCPDEYIYNSIRLSWDDALSDEDVDYVVNSIKQNVKKVRGY